MTVTRRSRQRARAWLGVLIFSLLMSACHEAPYVWVHSLPRDQLVLASDGRIVAGDTVSVRVFGQDSLTTQGRVRPNGTLALPLLGSVPMAGLRPDELARTLTESFRRYVNEPSVMVVIVDSQISVTAVGEVRQPGVLSIDPPATVLQALARAGGMTEFAKESSIFVLRSGSNQTRRIRFTYDALRGAEPAASAFQMRDGDVLVVE